MTRSARLRPLHAVLVVLLLQLRAQPAAAEGGPSALDIRAESGFLARSFRYTDPLADHRSDLSGRRPADYVSPGTPTFRLRVESYPLAAFCQTWPVLLGLHVDVSGGLPTTLHGGPDQTAQGSQTQGQLLLGAQMRIPLAALEFVPRVAWGLHGSYLHLDDATLEPPFPNVTYSFLEFGARLHGTVDQLHFEGTFGVRPGLTAGGIADATWFPHTTFFGIVTGASAGWSFHPALALRLSVDFIQYGLTFNPDVGQPAERVVGGATDQSVSATLGLEWRLASPAERR